jgi:diguanylate cyclase (GGDEF)-like protein
MASVGDSPIVDGASLEMSRLLRAGRFNDAVVFADRALTRLGGPCEAVDLLLGKLTALLNMQRTPECAAVLDAAWAQLQDPRATPAYHASFHSLAANLAFQQGSLHRCVTHLVRATQVLDITDANAEAMRSWLSTANTYSLVGFHRQAVNAQRRAQAISRIGSPEDRRLTAHPEIRVRHAVFLDQQCETQGASHMLGRLVSQLGPDDVDGLEHPYLGYAVARYAALGGECQTDARSLLRAEVDPAPEYDELVRLGEAALAIAEHRAGDALSLLEDAHTTYSMLGSGEVPRLRSLAFSQLGNYADAHEADQTVTYLLAQRTKRLYGLIIEGVTAQLDNDELRRNVGRYADEALTDPLTGLPNRRHLERYVQEILDRGDGATVGVADVDRFKDVNAVHGHLAGDQVLGQVAAIISRTLRAGDFLARYGGDEFVVVLPDTGLAEGREITGRLTAAVASHDWKSLVPRTPVSLTMGLSELDAQTGLAEAFKIADLQMLHSKPNAAQALTYADIELDVAAFRVTRAGKPIDLTRTELSLLNLFLRNPGRVLSRSQIFEAVWGYDFGDESNALLVAVSYLRSKLEAHGKPRVIQTVRGHGYVLREQA